MEQFLIEPLAESPEFEEEGHTYTVNGIPLLGVTSVIKEARMIDTRFFTTEQRDLGKRIHQFCELIDWGEEPVPDDDCIPYIMGYEAFKREHEVRWVYIERPCYHPGLYYAGTPDRVGFVDGEGGVVDIKKGGLYPSYALQIAAYANFFKDPFRLKLWDLMLKPDGSYRFEPVENFMENLNAFVSALNVVRWKRERGIAA